MLRIVKSYFKMFKAKYIAISFKTIKGKLNLLLKAT